MYVCMYVCPAQDRPVWEHLCVYFYFIQCPCSCCTLHVEKEGILIRTYVCVCMHVHMYEVIHGHLQTYMHTRTHTHIHTYTNTYTHIHTHTAGRTRCGTIWNFIRQIHAIQVTSCTLAAFVLCIYTSTHTYTQYNHSIFHTLVEYTLSLIHSRPENNPYVCVRPGLNAMRFSQQL
jgi:hypothetical protein